MTTIESGDLIKLLEDHKENILKTTLYNHHGVLEEQINISNVTITSDSDNNAVTVYVEYYILFENEDETDGFKTKVETQIDKQLLINAVNDANTNSQISFISNDITIDSYRGNAQLNSFTVTLEISGNTTEGSGTREILYHSDTTNVSFSNYQIELSGVGIESDNYNCESVDNQNLSPIYTSVINDISVNSTRFGSSGHPRDKLNYTLQFDDTSNNNTMIIGYDLNINDNNHDADSTKKTLLKFYSIGKVDIVNNNTILSHPSGTQIEIQVDISGN